MPIYNESEGLYVCPSCDGPVRFVGETAETIQMVKPVTRSRATFTRVKMPYAFKLLNQELGTYMNVGMRFVNSGSAARLKDETWDWSASVQEGRVELVELPPFIAPELPSSSASGTAGVAIEEIRVQVEKEPGVEQQPAVNPSLLEQERKRAEDAEAALAQAQEAGPPPETVQITLPGGPAEGPPEGQVTAGPPSQRGGSITLPTGPTGPVSGANRGTTNVITLVLPQQGKGAGRPATGNNSAYVPKKKGVALNRLLEEQEGQAEKVPESAKAADKGPVTIRVEKADMEESDKNQE